MYSMIIQIFILEIKYFKQSKFVYNKQKISARIFNFKQETKCINSSEPTYKIYSFIFIETHAYLETNGFYVHKN